MHAHIHTHKLGAGGREQREKERIPRTPCQARRLTRHLI